MFDFIKDLLVGPERVIKKCTTENLSRERLQRGSIDYIKWLRRLTAEIASMIAGEEAQGYNVKESWRQALQALELELKNNTKQDENI